MKHFIACALLLLSTVVLAHPAEEPDLVCTVSSTCGETQFKCDSERYAKVVVLAIGAIHAKTPLRWLAAANYGVEFQPSVPVVLSTTDCKPGRICWDATGPPGLLNDATYVLVSNWWYNDDPPRDFHGEPLLLLPCTTSGENTVCSLVAPAPDLSELHFSPIRRGFRRGFVRTTRTP